MVDVLRIKRRPVGGAVGPPATLAAAEIAFNEQDRTLYYGLGNSGGVATSIIPIAGTGGFLPLTGGTLSGAITVNATVNPGLHLSTTGVGAYIAVNAPATFQSAINFNEAGIGKWQIGRQTDNSFFMWDNVNAATVYSVTAAGALTLGESSQIQIPKTGVPTSLTPAAGNSSTQIATTAFVTSAINTAGVVVSDTAPVTPSVGSLWWDSVGANLYIRFNDGTSTQWVPTTNIMQGPAGQTGATGPQGVQGIQGPNWQVGTGLNLNISTTPYTVSMLVPVTIANGGTFATTSTQALLNLGAAPLASPLFTGDPRAPSPLPTNYSTSIATTAYVSDLVYGTAANYLPLAGGTLTGYLYIYNSGGLLILQDNTSLGPGNGGTIWLQNFNNAANQVTYAALNAYVTNGTTGAQYGDLVFKTARAGVLTEGLRLYSDGTLSTQKVNIGFNVPAGAASLNVFGHIRVYNAYTDLSNGEWVYCGEWSGGVAVFGTSMNGSTFITPRDIAWQRGGVNKLWIDSTVRVNDNTRFSVGLPSTTNATTNLASIFVVRDLVGLGTTVNSYRYSSEFQYPAGGSIIRLLVAGYRRVAGSAWQGSGYRLQLAVDNAFTDTTSRAHMEFATDAAGNGVISLATNGVERLVFDNTGIAQFPGKIASSGGLDLGSAVAPGGVTDLTRHLSLYGGYGLNITGGRMNFVTPVSSSQVNVINGADIFVIAPTAVSANVTLIVNSHIYANVPGAAVVIQDTRALASGNGGVILLRHYNVSGAQVNYAGINSYAGDGTTGAEAGDLVLKTLRAGTLTEGARVYASGTLSTQKMGIGFNTSGNSQLNNSAGGGASLAVNGHIRVFNGYGDNLNGTWAYCCEWSGNIAVYGTAWAGTGTPTTLMVQVSGTNRLDYSVTSNGYWTSSAPFSVLGSISTQGANGQYVFYTRNTAITNATTWVIYADSLWARLWNGSYGDIFSTTATADVGLSGTLTLTGRFNASEGIMVGAPTGGYKGAGTLNAVTVYGSNVVLTSDARLKTGIEKLPLCLGLVSQIEPKQFKFVEPEPPRITRIGPRGETIEIDNKGHPDGFYDKTYWGFLAQDVETVMKDAGHEFGGNVTGPDGTKGLGLGDMVAVLWQAVRELSSELAELKKSKGP